MKNQDFNDELISYLYGEMPEEERLAFEQKMEQNPVLKEEFEALSNVRKEIAGLEDRDIVAPWFSGKPEGDVIQPMGISWFHSIIKPVMAVAASLTLLLVTGFLTNFHISISNGNFSMGFQSKQELPVQQILTEAEIRGIMKDELAHNTTEVLATAEKQNVEMDTRIGAIEKSVKTLKANSSKSIVSKEDLERFFTLAETRNTEAMKEFMTAATAQQQQYLKALFTEYNDYLQQQREDDLALIRSGFIEMKQSQTQQKLETDQVLASLISTVSTK